MWVLLITRFQIELFLFVFFFDVFLFFVFSFVIFYLFAVFFVPFLRCVNCEDTLAPGGPCAI